MRVCTSYDDGTATPEGTAIIEAVAAVPGGGECNGMPVGAALPILFSSDADILEEVRRTVDAAVRRCRLTSG